MSGLAEIVQGYAAIKQEEAAAVLATVVKAKGSVQRGVGARMLIREDHSTTGSCFNADLDNLVVGRALEILTSHQPMSVVFEVGSTAKNGSARDTTSFGVIHVLLEPLPFSARSSHLRFIDDCLRSRTTGVVASVFRSDGEIKAAVGSHVFLHGDGRIEEDVRNPVLSAAITEDCVQTLGSKSTIIKEYRFTEGVVEALLEFIDPS